MNDNTLLTPEQRREIIDEHIETTRDALSTEVGDSLLVAGYCTMCMAVVVAVLNYMLRAYGSGIGQLLWLVNPFIIWAIAYHRNRKCASNDNLVHTIVHKTWLAFGIFAFGFFTMAMLFNYVESQMEGLEVFTRVAVKPFRVVLLLMGMSLTITGFVLKHYWLVACGVIAGLGGFFWISLQYSTYLLSQYRAMDESSLIQELITCVVVVVFAFFCIFLPGHILKHK